MFDYDDQYKELREAGHKGWAGPMYERGLARLTEVVHQLELRGVISPTPVRILEIGCGNGTLAFLMAQKGHHVYGVDISETAIAWARERFEDSGLLGSFWSGDVCHMPFFSENMFEIVMDGACLHCLIGDARSDCFAEIRRVLRPDGIFIVSTMCGLPKSEDVWARYDPKSGCLIKNHQPYRTLKPLIDINRELSDAGFAVEDCLLKTNPWWDHATIVCRSAAHTAGGQTEKTP